MQINRLIELEDHAIISFLIFIAMIKRFPSFIPRYFQIFHDAHLNNQFIELSRVLYE